jgi:hypothetical protein
MTDRAGASPGTISIPKPAAPDSQDRPYRYPAMRLSRAERCGCISCPSMARSST